MKRSEMINEIALILNSIYSIGNPMEFENDLISSESLLILIEKLGMLPPVRPHKIPHAYIRFVEHCRWETEDVSDS